MEKKYLALVLALILIISGCINLNTGETTTKASSLYKGTSGLALSFIKNAPPSRVFEKTDFNVVVKIENKGAYDIGFEEGESNFGRGFFVITPETGYVNIKDIDENEGVVPGEGIAFFEVRGKSLSNSAGDEINIYSTLKAGELSSLSQVHSSSIFATVCYPYQTKLSTSICIDSDTLGSGKKACEVKDLAFSGGQGGPIAVTKIEVQMAPEDGKIKPQLVIHMENQGKGEVVKKEKYEYACMSEMPEETNQLDKYFNVVNINNEKSKLSDKKLVCGTDEKNVVILSGKKGVIRCSPEEWGKEDKNAYVTPLSIVLDYGYSSTISKEFNIEKPK